MLSLNAAPNYCYRCGNVASILELGEDLEQNYKVFDAAPQDAKGIPAKRPLPEYCALSSAQPPVCIGHEADLSFVSCSPVTLRPIVSPSPGLPVLVLDLLITSLSRTQLLSRSRPSSISTFTISLASLTLNSHTPSKWIECVLIIIIITKPSLSSQPVPALLHPTSGLESVRPSASWSPPTVSSPPYDAPPAAAHERSSGPRARGRRGEWVGWGGRPGGCRLVDPTGGKDRSAFWYLKVENVQSERHDVRRSGGGRRGVV